MKTYRLIFFALFLTGLTILTFSPPLIALNLKALDLFQKDHLPHPDIVILAIDNKAIQKFGRWPWSRTIHAQIIDKVSPSSPSALGIDILFSEPENEMADTTLTNSLSKAQFPIVLASQAIFFQNSQNPQKILTPLEQFRKATHITFGHTNLPSSEDGLSREFPKLSPSFSLEFANRLNNQPPIGDFLVNFAGTAGSFSTYSLADLMDNKIPKDKLSGKIILIGATASDLHDTILTPKGVLAGVEYNANILDNLLLQRPITLLPKIISLLIGIFIIAAYFLYQRILRPKIVTWILIVFILISPLLSFLLWQFNLALFYFSNLSLVFLLVTFHGIYHWYRSEVEKRKIRQTFQHYFSPQVMEEILKNPDALKLGGQKKEVTILFSDIRNFTTITESLPPEQLTMLLQEYFTEMSKEILATDGVLDKFIGDAIMAFWGAPVEQPDHADRAVKTAVTMIKRLKVLQKKWLRQGLPEIDAGVGINTGVVTVGNMGSTERFDYTLIGDAVNAAARLEGLNKEYKTHIIISESTKKSLVKKYPLKSLGQVLVKGKAKPIKIYHLT